MIRSPNFPNSYPPVIKRAWTVMAPPGYTIEVKFDVFQLGGCVSRTCNTSKWECSGNIQTEHRADWVDIKRQIWKRARFENPRIREERAQIGRVGRENLLVWHHITANQHFDLRLFEEEWCIYNNRPKRRSLIKCKVYPFALENQQKWTIFCMEADFERNFLNLEYASKSDQRQIKDSTFVT